MAADSTRTALAMTNAGRVVIAAGRIDVVERGLRGTESR